MNFLKAFAIVAIAGGFVACSDENASAVWNSAELSSSTVIPDSKVSEPAELPGSSSGFVIPDSVPGTPSSSSTENVAQSSSSETVADTVWHIEYNGCTWAGYFAGVEGQMTEEWVSQHNIIAVHEKDWNQYKLKTFRLRMNGSTIDAVVYDMCSDSDCDGCCTENAGEIGFLIDIEKYTRERFDGNGDGVVEWTCLDCE